MGWPAVPDFRAVRPVTIEFDDEYSILKTKLPADLSYVVSSCIHYVHTHIITSHARTLHSSQVNSARRCVAPSHCALYWAACIALAMDGYCHFAFRKQQAHGDVLVRLVPLPGSRSDYPIAR